MKAKGDSTRTGTVMDDEPFTPGVKEGAWGSGVRVRIWDLGFRVVLGE